MCGESFLWRLYYVVKVLCVESTVLEGYKVQECCVWECCVGGNTL